MSEQTLCIDCDKPVDTDHPLAMWEVAGFVKARKRGVNAPKYRRRTGRWLCPNCGMRRELGTHPDQLTLHEYGLVEP